MCFLLCESFQNLCFSKAVFYYRSKWLHLFVLIYNSSSIQRFQFSQGNIDFYFVWFQHLSFVWRLDLHTNLGICLIKSSWHLYSLIYLMVEINWCSYFAHSVHQTMIIFQFDSWRHQISAVILNLLLISKLHGFFHVWIKEIKIFMNKEIANSSFN